MAETALLRRVLPMTLLFPEDSSTSAIRGISARQ
jgi:hypothetical protein